MEKFVVRSKRKTESNNETEIRKALKITEGTPKKEDLKVATIGNLLPEIKRDKSKAISDDDLQKLFVALCGETGKEYDSDDSIISDIDHMDDEEIAAKDKRFRQTIESVATMESEYKRVQAILKIGNETKEEKEERKKLIRELKEGLKTKEEKENAEEKIQKKKRKMEKKWKTNVNVFEIDVEKKPSNVPLISCSTFANLLEIMTEFVSDDVEDKEYRENIKQSGGKEFSNKIKLMGIKSTFYTEDKELDEYLKKKIRKILIDPNIVDVLDVKRYGFDFSTKDCLLSLENYFSLNKPKKDNGISDQKALSINIRKFVKSCFHVARAKNPSFELNENLKHCLFD